MEIDFNGHMLRIITLLIAISLVIGNQIEDDDYDKRMHPSYPSVEQSTVKSTVRAGPQIEKYSSFWNERAQLQLLEKIRRTRNLNKNVAKNIIFFLGDGMSLQTVAATRMYMGGEQLDVFFERFPHFGLSKTYCVDAQTADSACSSTAYTSGIKANIGTIGVDARVLKGNCSAYLETDARTESIAKWAQDTNRGTGFITTTRVTHASPAGLYAHIAHRDWENDLEIIESGCDPIKNIDITRQLIESDVGKNLKVILGGGRAEFRDKSMVDEEGLNGWRGDGRDLINQWLTEHNQLSNSSYVWNEAGLRSIDPDKTEYLLGLFEADHCQYNLDIERKSLDNEKPTLSEMTEVAIKMLQKEANGFYLFIEGGRIDHGHHDNFARLALDETVEFSRAIQLAFNMTDSDDTLIVVTSDHAHTMSYNGYSSRGNNVLGLIDKNIGEKGQSFPTLSYANGKGYNNLFDSETGLQKDLTALDFSDIRLRSIATVPAGSETHGGDDVGIYASGPWSHLFDGTMEQNTIPILMAYASNLGPYRSSVAGINQSILLLAAVICLYVFNLLK